MTTTANSRIIKSGYTAAQMRQGMLFALIAWGFGAPFYAITTGGALTSFLQNYLKTDDLSYGLIMASGSAAAAFQYIGSYLVERTGRVKRNFLIFVTLHRLLWLGVAAVPFLAPATPYSLKVWIVGLCVFFSALSCNIGGTGWVTWMSEIVPRSFAGKYFGFRSRVGLIAMIITSSVMALLLDHFKGQGWMYGIVFATAAILGAMDILSFIPIAEKPIQRDESVPRATFWEIISVPWLDRKFRSICLFTFIMWVSYIMMNSFVWRFCFDSTQSHGLQMNILTATLVISILPMIPMAWVAPYWGQAIDRYGPKPVLALSSLCHIILPLGWLFMRPDFFWILPLMAILGGLTWPGNDQVLFFIQLKEFPIANRTAYNATFLVVVTLAGLAGNSLGGLLAFFSQSHFDVINASSIFFSHYQPVFVFCLLMRLAAFLFLLPRLPLPGVAEHHEVARTLAKKASSSFTMKR
ncbi:MAG: MFS transporter [bacterium]